MRQTQRRGIVKTLQEAGLKDDSGVLSVPIVKQQLHLCRVITLCCGNVKETSL